MRARENCSVVRVASYSTVMATGVVAIPSSNSPPPKRRKIEHDRHDNDSAEDTVELGIDDLSDSGSSCQGKEQSIEIPHYCDLKSKNGKWESQPLYTRSGFKFVLIVRPNGLKYTKSFNRSIGIWLKPVPSDSELNFPADVTLALRVGLDAEGDGLLVPPTRCTWKKEDTHSRYPVVAFEPTITHTAVEKATNCFIGENLLITIVEVDD